MTPTPDEVLARDVADQAGALLLEVRERFGWVGDWEDQRELGDQGDRLAHC